jgi:hypothetical protein
MGLFVIIDKNDVDINNLEIWNQEKILCFSKITKWNFVKNIFLFDFWWKQFLVKFYLPYGRTLDCQILEIELLCKTLWRINKKILLPPYNFWSVFYKMTKIFFWCPRLKWQMCKKSWFSPHIRINPLEAPYIISTSIT